MFSRAYVEITNRCNLHCAFCPGTQRPLRDMTPAEFETVLTQLRPLTRYLYLHVMGEPLLHPRLETLLSLAAERDFRVCLTTNGVLLPRQTALLLSAPALHKVSVSLHSFEGNEGGALLPYLNDVWDFVHQAAAQGIICVLRLWNGGGAEDCNQTILDFLVEKTGVAATAWGCPRPGTRRLDDHLFLEYAAKFDWPEQTAPTADTEFCYALREQVAVLADGTVVPCCLDHEGDLALGNLFHQTAEDILSCRRARAIYDGFSQRQPAEELCRRCGYATRFSL